MFRCVIKNNYNEANGLNEFLCTTKETRAHALYFRIHTVKNRIVLLKLRESDFNKCTHHLHNIPQDGVRVVKVSLHSVTGDTT